MPRARHPVRPCAHVAAALALLFSVGAGPCQPAPPGFGFQSPATGLLSLADGDPLTFVLGLPDGDVERIRVRLNEETLLEFGPGEIAPGTQSLTGEVPRIAGRHVLDAEVTTRVLLFFFRTRTTSTWVEFVALDRPDDCEVLNGVECSLPFPSSRYLEPASTPTGVRVRYPEGVLPEVPDPVSSEAFSGQDGFSPGVQVLVHFPGGVSPELSGASRLLPETRSYDTTSLESSSPTLLLDADAGMAPVLHWIERDAQAADGPDPSREGLFLRPGRTLEPGHRYVVAFRNLVHPDGSPVAAEAVFAALRDGRPTDIPGVSARRAKLEALFEALEGAGHAREELVLAFDFVVESRDSLHRAILAMRERSFAWLDAQTQPTFEVFPFTDVPEEGVPSSVENDCAAPETNFWRQVHGTFAAPLFLAGDPLLTPVELDPLVDDDGDGLPDIQGTMRANFSVSIPCEALDEGAAPLRPMLIGHGLFGSGASTVGIPGLMDDLLVESGREGRLVRISGATDWLGLSMFDFSFQQFLAPSFILNVLRNPGEYGALPDRLRQGMTNTLVLARMLREGAFNAHAAFHTPNGTPLFPDAGESVEFWGISLGGIMGLELAALSPDLGRVGLNVPASNFSILNQRSRAFGLLGLVLSTLNPDPLTQALYFGLSEELMDSGEPVAYLPHIVQDPLPGSGEAKDVLINVARFDGIVSNAASEITLRSMGLPNLHDAGRGEGSAIGGLVGIEDVSPPLAPDDRDFRGAFAIYDLAMYDLADPDIAEFVPPLSNTAANSNCDPHPWSFRVPALLEQLSHFYDTGEIDNFCDGLCDGRASDGSFAPGELYDGRTEPCDPLTEPPPVFDR